MTNREKYKQAFSGLHASIDVGMEDIMKKKSANMAKRIAVAAVALAIGFAGSNGVCYAATGETWVEKVFVKVNGVDKEAIVTENEDGSVNYDIKLDPYQDGENNVERGVVISADKEDTLEEIIVNEFEAGNGFGVEVTITNDNPENETEAE